MIRPIPSQSPPRNGAIQSTSPTKGRAPPRTAPLAKAALSPSKIPEEPQTARVRGYKNLFRRKRAANVDDEAAKVEEHVGKLHVHDADAFVQVVVGAMQPILVDEDGKPLDNNNSTTKSKRRPARGSLDLETFVRQTEAGGGNTARPLKDRKKKLSATQKRQIELQRKRRQEIFEQDMERTRRQRQRQLLRQTIAQDEKFVREYNNLVLERQNFVDKHVQDILDYHETNDQMKRRQLYEEWLKNVYEPVQKQIESQLGTLTQEELNNRRNLAFEKYLQESNKRPMGLFRDIIIEAYYDPLEYNNKYTIKYNANLDDPAKKSLVQHRKERQTKKEMLTLMRGARQTKLSPQLLSTTDQLEEFETDRDIDGDGYRKDLLDIRQWARVEDTTYGRYSQMFDKPQRKNEKPTEIQLLREKLLRSHVQMEQFNIPQGPDALRTEIPPGKRVTYPQAVSSSKGMVDMVTGFENARARARSKKILHINTPNEENDLDRRLGHKRKAGQHNAATAHLIGPQILSGDDLDVKPMPRRAATSSAEHHHLQGSGLLVRELPPVRVGGMTP